MHEKISAQNCVTQSPRKMIKPNVNSRKIYTMKINT